MEKVPRQLRKLWKLEARDAKGGFSNHAITLNKTFMRPSFRKKLERYAWWNNIPFEKAVGRALSVAERLHSETSKEWTGKKSNLNLILLGSEEPAYHLHLLRHLMEVGIPGGKMPKSVGEVEAAVGEGREWDAVGHKVDASVIIKLGFGSYRIFDGSGGESLRKAMGAAYGKKTSDFVLKVLNGRRLNKKDIGVVVHEVGESLGEIECEPMHTLDKPTEREKEIRQKMLARLKGIFPEYYS